MKVLCFDIWGDYGHFRKFYTTSSPLTFSFPPPPTLTGIIGAIYGAERDEYLEIFSFSKCRIALRIMNPVKKVRMGINLINTKGKHWSLHRDKYHEPRTQIRTEFLREPCYRIYFSHKDQYLQKKLAEQLLLHESVYTPSLGLSELIANFRFEGEFEAEFRETGGFVDLSSPVIFSNIIDGNIEIESGKRYFKEKIPIMMNQDRVVECYGDVIFEADGKSIKANVKNYCALENGENVTFF